MPYNSRVSSEVGIGTVVGVVALIWLSFVSGALSATVELIAESIMPFKIEKMSQVEADETFKRTRSADNVEEYVTMLRDLNVTSVGDTFKLALETVTVQPDESDENQTPFEVEILSGSLDEAEPEGISVRAAKRRFNAAAKVLGFSLSWKEPAGWLIARAVASKVEVTAAPSADSVAPETSADAESDEEDLTEDESDETPTSAASMPATTTVRRRRR